MPELPLTLLKEKIIKTDIIIQLLADKNEQIAQLREKLKMLYHKHVNKVKKCEELQLKIDLCKIEHDPLDTNLKELLQKYKDLQEQHQLLTNSSEIRYQNKCMELEIQISNYNDLLNQKEKCSTCHSLSNKFNSISKKYEKINKELVALTGEYENCQKEIKNLRNNNFNVENKYSSQLKTMKDGYISEITNLQNLVTTLKLSESKLNDEILQLHSKLNILNQKRENCNVKDRIEYHEDNVMIEQSNDNIEEWEYIRNLLKYEYVGEPLSPIVSPLNKVILTEVRGNEYIEDRNSGNESVVTNLDGNDKKYLSECEDLIEDTGGCDEIGDICFSSAISPVFDKSTDVVNNSCDHSEEDIHEKNIGNNYNENNENNLSKESEPITFDRTVDTDDLKQICTEKVKSQELCIDLDLSGITATSSSENSGFIINKEIQIPSGANLEIINDDNESLEHKSNNNQIYTDISQRKTINFRSEENMDVVLTNNENQYRANDDTDNLLRTEDRCNKSSEINVINTETAFMSSTGSQSCETLYLECNEYLHKISFQSKDEKYTPVIEDRDLIGFLADNCIVKETDNIPNTYSEVSINNRENSTVLVPFESNASRVIGNDAVQHPTITLYDIGIQTGDCENSIIDMKSSGSTNTIMKTDLKRPVIKKSISTLISEHITHIDDTCINLLKDTLKSQRGSNEYFPHSVLNGDFLGFTKKVRKLTNRERPEVRVIRKRMNWNRMKAELFHSLVKYFNKKMKFNQTNFLRQGNNSSLSSNSKNARRLRMLRWKKLREFYLSSTDTDSDRTKNSRHVKKRSKCKTPENKAFKEINDPSCNSSEDEYIFKMVISEQQKYQRLFLEQQELEEFYNTLVDNVVNNDSSDQAKKSNDLSFSKSDNCGTWQQDNVSFIVDKDDVNSGDSGYSKSDSDNVSIKPDYKKKRIGDFKTDKNIHNKKRAAIKCLSNKTCDLKRHERSCIIDREKQNCKETKTDSSEAVNINSERPHDLHLTDANLESVEVSHEPKSKKECITADICSLLHSSSSEENKILVNDDILKETFDVNQCYLFSSDCESISINDEDKLIETDPFDTKTKDDNKKQEESLGTRVFKCDHKIIANCKRQSCYDNPNKPLNQIRQSNHSSATLKVSTQQKRKKSTSKIHSTPVSNQPTPSQFQGTIDIEDPLHVRLQQESLKDVPRVVKPGETIRTAFKRSNSLKKRQTLLETIALNIEQNNTVILPKEINTLSGKPKKLHEEKAKALLQQILTFPDKPSIIDEVSEIFSKQDMTYISRIIILEVSLDTNKADTKYTPPAPVLTKTQRILLGLLVKLNQSESAGILDVFTVEAEKYILTSTNLQCIENLTRLYLAVCKLERKIHRMRRMVCDAFYFMGDFSIPFLFTVLSTWIEVMPMESDKHGGLMVKVIIEIIKQKKCAIPGYNLLPLKSLLKAYYGYNLESSSLDSLFLEIFQKYEAKQEKSLEYTILILFKNLESTWIKKKIDQYIKPAIENSKNIVQKTNLSRLIEKITQENVYTSG